MIHKIILATLVLLFLSCSEKGSKVDWDIPIQNQVTSSFSVVEIEEFQLNDFQSSYIGTIESIKDTLIFIDYRFGWIFFFNENGGVVKRILGSGISKYEIPSANIRFYSKKPDSGFVFIGNSLDIHDFDKDLSRKGSFYIDWNTSKSTEYLSKVAEPNNVKSYNFAYNVSQTKATEEFLYIPLSSPPPLHSDFNLTTDFYAKNARIIAKMNLNNGKVETLLGGLSPEYYEHPKKRLFSSFNFDISKSGDVFITFQADSIIYKFDKSLNKIKKKFGFSGKKMNLNYKVFPDNLTEVSLEKYWKAESVERGYYTYLKYFEESDLLFRGYKKGKNVKSDGLQIYHRETLISDIEVPKEFIISAYVKPYYYSNIYVDEETKEVKIYRFKLNI